MSFTEEVLFILVDDFNSAFYTFLSVITLIENIFRYQFNCSGKTEPIS